MSGNDEMHFDDIVLTGEPIMAPTTGTLRVTKAVVNNNGGTKVRGNFTINVTSVGSSTSFAGGVSTTVIVAPGAYSIDETADGGYAKTLSADCSGTIAAGQTKDCTITNDDIAPKIALAIVVDNSTWGGTAVPANFQIAATNGSTVFLTDGAATPVNAGTWTLGTSTAPFGYDLAWSGDADCADGTVTVAVGDATKSCTATFTSRPATVIVTKTVTNNNGGLATSSAFRYFIDTTPVATEVLPGTPVNVPAGTYTVSETELDGITPPLEYTPTFYANCSIISGSYAQLAVGVGEVKTCGITNDDEAAHLTVKKQVVTDNGGTATSSSFTMHVVGVYGESPVVYDFAGDAGTGWTVLLDANEPYEVTETGLTGYALTATSGCAGVLSLNENRTCTMVNDDIQPKLTVTKVVVNDNGASSTAADFPLFVDATPVVHGVQNGFNAAWRVVSETSDYRYAATFSGDCDVSGNIQLLPGDVKQCTITNDDKPGTVQVFVNVTNPGIANKVPGDFSVTLTAIDPSQSAFFGSASGTLVTMDVGAYGVSSVDDPEYREFYGTDCAGTVDFGETKSCFIDYEYVPQQNSGGALTGGAGGSTSVGGSVLGAATTTPSDDEGSAPTSTEPQPRVLGDQKVCDPYLGTNLHLGVKNPDAVKKLQRVLNQDLGKNLLVDGVFSSEVFEAVKQFQLKYKSEILDPWIPFGLPNAEPTGYVGKMTNWKIDSLQCGNSELPKPQLP